jgi:3-dehydroquinate synthetase
VSTPFKALKELSNYSHRVKEQIAEEETRESLLHGENVNVGLDYAKALKELQNLKKEIKNYAEKEEELQSQVGLLENYNSKVEMMEFNLRNLQVQVQEYKSQLKIKEKWMVWGVGIIVILLGLYLSKVVINL